MNPWGGLASPATLGCALVSSIGLAVFVRAVANGDVLTSWTQKLNDYRRNLHRTLAFVRSDWSAERVVQVQGVLTLGALLGSLQVLGAVLLLIPILFGPIIFFEAARSRRVRAIEQQVESWMGSLARALEAAPSLGEAVEATIMASASPMRQEIELLVREMKLGRSLERALTAWEERVNSEVLSLALSTLQIGRQTGGSLPEVLKGAAAALREMERLQGVIRTKTAEGKAQSYLIGALPIPLFLLMNWSDPKHFDPLRYTPVGNVLVAIAAALWIAALLAAKKILAVRI